MTDPTTLKNNTQRNEWLRNYKDWGVWYVDDNIGATYYKYDFQNGARLIVDEYISPGNEFIGPYTEHFFHLVGGPRIINSKWTWHKTYCRYADAETFLLAFLRDTKGGAE